MGSWKRRRSVRCKVVVGYRPAAAWCLGLTLALGGCCEFYEVPDQSAFESLGAVAGRREAVVRAYGAPIIGLGPFAVHTWVITKRPASAIFHRWEIWLCPGGGFGYVCQDFNPLPGTDGPDFVIGELSGPEAERVIELESAMLFFPEERPADFNRPLQAFWGNLS